MVSSMKFRLVKIIFLFLVVFIPASVSQAESLSAQQIARVKACKRLIAEVDIKSLQRSIDELEASLYPELNLEIMEAVTQAYDDIVREQNVTKLKDKEWLYAMITLNMANLQFGGGVGKNSRDAGLNRLIERKLKEYLPAEALNHPGFSKSVE